MVEVRNKDLFNKKLGVDIVAAASAAFGVSPFIAIIDRSIIENASGRNTLERALKSGFIDLFTKPHRFLRAPPFLLVFGVYFATYTTANVIDTVCEKLEKDNQAPKFFGTTIANMTTCIYKDRAFTRMFGVVAPKGLPLSSYGMFISRDALTMAASFNMPEAVAETLQRRGLVLDPQRAINTAQLLCPIGVQFVSVVLHLLGLDFYNRPDISLATRAQFISKIYVKTTLTRIARIGPAFGIGGIGNRMVRDRGNEYIRR